MMLNKERVGLKADPIDIAYLCSDQFGDAGILCEHKNEWTPQH